MSDLFANTEDSLDEARSLIALSEVPKLGSKRIRPLLSVFKSAAAVLQASRDQLLSIDGVGGATVQAIKSFDRWNEVDRQLEAGNRVGAHLVSLTDDRYPALLRHIYDAPPYLWVRGELPKSKRVLAIVGSRDVTNYGKKQARRLARALVQEGFVVVSGLAYGIDAAAHEATVRAGGDTVAVLGSGIDWIYPSKNARLAREIMEQGAVVSDFPPGTKPGAGNFPMRNRIISGMSLGTLVVEAYEKSGSLITARLSLDQNREVFAVPGRPTLETCQGTNRLIQRGHAKLVMDVDDILEELEALLPERPTSISDNGSEKVVDMPNVELSTEESSLMENIADQPVHVDELCEHTGMDASEVLVHLLSLEMKGLIEQQSGRQVVRA